MNTPGIDVAEGSCDLRVGWSGDNDHGQVGVVREDAAEELAILLGRPCADRVAGGDVQEHERPFIHPPAMELAGTLGVPAAEIEAVADSDAVREALRSHLRIAADLGLYATPSYVLGNAGILGHPGARSLARMIASTRRCDKLAC